MPSWLRFSIFRWQKRAKPLIVHFLWFINRIDCKSRQLIVPVGCVSAFSITVTFHALIWLILPFPNARLIHILVTCYSNQKKSELRWINKSNNNTVQYLFALKQSVSTHPRTPETCIFNFAALSHSVATVMRTAKFARESGIILTRSHIVFVLLILVWLKIERQDKYTRKKSRFILSKTPFLFDIILAKCEYTKLLWT